MMFEVSAWSETMKILLWKHLFGLLLCGMCQFQETDSFSWVLWYHI
jgi:hypothetical protein